jgi:endonuclease YncB( thermonuclease family)
VRLGVLVFALVLVLGLPASAATTQFARIQYVIDGDTVALANGERVRLVQIDSPEVQERECYGAAAQSALRRLVQPGTTVRLEADPRLDQVDRYGRLLRYLFRGPLNLNLELVRRGAATVWFYHRDRGRYASALLRAARQARAERRGRWGACPGTPFDPYHAADTGP